MDAILLRGGGEKPIHTWKRYEINSSTSYTWNRWNLVSTTVYKWNKWNTTTGATERIVSPDNSEFGPGFVHGNYSPEMVSNGGRTYAAYYTSNGTRMNSSMLNQVIDSSNWLKSGYAFYEYAMVSGSSGGNAYHHYKYKITSAKYTGNTNDYGEYVFKISTMYEAYEGAIKGSTSYGQVTSTSSSAYPSNGASGSYWYESAGSEVQYSKGSTQYADVSSTSSSAYPDNGHDGSYWYNNKQTIINHSMGNYIEDAFSIAQDTYPANGISGSYWYVYQGQL